ncbi:hypothetical protein Poly30_06530 [Planctomycetes bacterium Poly30]|uniref:Uncharacterized protein n=2 Tax=Saltatorellus ferox TaxID=2528018 RepID=A0A518EM38_9BACT|nr:hypothetical protein Poly30_06530 [Planctomycetes bacterium Poly30]
MPTAQSGGDTRQGPTRLKNLVRRVESELEDGTPGKAAAMEWFRSFVEDDDFWQHQRHGLMLLWSPTIQEEWRLPFDLPECAHVSSRFHLKHAIHVANSPAFELLAFSRGAIRYFHGDASHIQQLEIEGIPADINEFLRFHDFEEQVQSHSVSGAPKGSGKQPAMTQHSSAGLSDRRSDDLDRFAHEVAKVIDRRRAQQKSPLWLILAATERDVAAYRKGSRDPKLCEMAIHGNCDRIEPEALRAQGWKIASHYWDDQHSAARDRVLAGVGNDRGTANLTGVLNAAHQGRVSTLFVASDREVLGQFDAVTGKVKLAHASDSHFDDLLDEAACLASMHGADVHVLPQEEMPTDGQIVAALRS